MKSNSLATILLIVPVLTVPALAIFGIPQFRRSSLLLWKKRETSTGKNELEIPHGCRMTSYSTISKDLTRSVPKRHHRPP